MTSDNDNESPDTDAETEAQREAENDVMLAMKLANMAQELCEGNQYNTLAALMMAFVFTAKVTNPNGDIEILANKMKNDMLKFWNCLVPVEMADLPQEVRDAIESDLLRQRKVDIGDVDEGSVRAMGMIFIGEKDKSKLN